MPPAPSTQATPPIIGTADWPMRAARHAGQAPRAPASTSPPALTAIVWIWQCRGDRQPGDLRCLGRAPAHPHFRPVVARGNYGRPGPGNQLCEPERPRAPREPALNSRHRSSPARTAQGRRLVRPGESRGPHVCELIPVYQTPVLYSRFPRTFSAAYRRCKNGYAPRYTTAPSLPWRPSHHQPLANRHGDR